MGLGVDSLSSIRLGIREPGPGAIGDRGFGRLTVGLHGNLIACGWRRLLPRVGSWVALM